MINTRNSFKTYLSAFAPPIVWAGLIYVLSAQEVLPGLSISVLDFLLKKVSHIVVYAVLYLLIYRGLQLTIHKRNQATIHWLPIVICILYATIDELHQSIVPGRYATLRDIGYDMLGASITLMRKFEYV